LNGVLIAHAHGAAVVSLGTVGTRQGALDTLRRHRRPTRTQRVVDAAAGPCGSWLARALLPHGDVCGVVAPSVRPTQAGDRVTTARRDALPLARLMRSGDLPPGSVPAVDDAAIRARRRAREETLRDLQAATVRRTACVLRPALRAPGRAPWSPAHLRWRREVLCPTPAQPMVVQADVQTVTAQPARLGRLEHARHEQGHTWRLAPVVEALQAWRGVPCTGAVTTVAARGDLPRVENP
jgi:hypothetical protein